MHPTIRLKTGHIVTTCPRCKELPWGLTATQRCLCDGFNLDIGCGPNKQPGYVGMDLRDVPGVDIVWDMQSVEDPPHWAKKLGAKPDPWPFLDNSVDLVLMSHVLEHMKPWCVINVMNELWRVMKGNATAFIAIPHGNSQGYIQDPTHATPFNEATWEYFKPENDILYRIYRPAPWQVLKMNSHPLHNMEVILKPIKPDVAKEQTKDVNGAKGKNSRKK